MLIHNCIILQQAVPMLPDEHQTAIVWELRRVQTSGFLHLLPTGNENHVLCLRYARVHFALQHTRITFLHCSSADLRS